MIRPLRTLLHGALVGLLVLGAAACGSDDGGDDNKTPADTSTSDTGVADTSVPDTAQPQPDADPTQPAATHQPRAFRITKMDIVQPTGVIITALESLIKKDLGKVEDPATQLLHVLIDMKDFSADRGDATFKITGNAGKFGETNTEYTWSDLVVDDIEYKNANITASGNVSSDERLNLVFPAIDPADNTKFLLIPIRDISLTADVTVAEKGELKGRLEGAILKEDGDNINIELGGPPRSLTELLKPGTMDYPRDQETKTGWILVADIDAVEIELVEPAGSGE